MTDTSDDTVSYSAEELKAMRDARGGHQIEMLDDAAAAKARADDPDAATTYPGWEETITLSLPETKKQLTLRLDADVVRWFRGTGKGYQTPYERSAARLHGAPG